MSLRSPRSLLPDSQGLLGMQQRRSKDKSQARTYCLSQDTGPRDIWLVVLLPAAPPPLCLLSIHLSPCLAPSLSSPKHCSWLEGREGRGCRPSSLAHIHLHLHPLHSLCHRIISSLSFPSLHPMPQPQVNSWMFLIAGHFAGRDGSPLNWAFPEQDDWGLCLLGFLCCFCFLAALCAQGWEKQSQVTCPTHQG